MDRQTCPYDVFLHVTLANFELKGYTFSHLAVACDILLSFGTKDDSGGQ